MVESLGSIMFIELPKSPLSQPLIENEESIILEESLDELEEGESLDLSDLGLELEIDNFVNKNVPPEYKAAFRSYMALKQEATTIDYADIDLELSKTFWSVIKEDANGFIESTASNKYGEEVINYTSQFMTALEKQIIHGGLISANAGLTFEVILESILAVNDTRLLLNGYSSEINSRFPEKDCEILYEKLERFIQQKGGLINDIHTTIDIIYQG